MLLEVENLPLPEEEDIDYSKPFLAASHHNYKGMETHASNIFICCYNQYYTNTSNEYVVLHPGLLPRYLAKGEFVPLPKSFRIILTQ